MWNNEKELSFLENFQSEPVLWDPKHPCHKNKTQVSDAWGRLSLLLDVPVADLKKKRDSLMSSYRKYKKMVRDSIHSGAGSSEVYKPIWFAYDLMDSFLGERDLCRRTINTESNDDQQTSNIDVTDEGEERPYDDDNDASTISRSTTPQSSESQSNRRRKRSSLEEEAGSYIKQAVATLNLALKKKDPPPEDDCDLYGKMLAKKLRRLTEEERLQFMFEIDGIFLRRRSSIPLYHQTSYQSPTFNQSPTPSCSSSTTSSYENVNQSQFRRFPHQQSSNVMHPRDTTSYSEPGAQLRRYSESHSLQLQSDKPSSAPQTTDIAKDFL